MPKIDAVKELELFSGVNRSHHRLHKGMPVAGCGPLKAPASGYALWQLKLASHGFPRTAGYPSMNARVRASMWSLGSLLAAPTLFRRWFLGHSNVFLSRTGHTCHLQSLFTHSPQTPSSGSCPPPHTLQLTGDSILERELSK